MFWDRRITLFHPFMAGYINTSAFQSVFSVASLYVYACNMIPGTSGMDSTMNKASERSSVVS